VRNALNYLRNLPPPNKTYATALQTMALAAAEPERDLAIITRNARWLEHERRSSKGPERATGDMGIKGGRPFEYTVRTDGPP
jgi:hypothetical protein